MPKTVQKITIKNFSSHLTDEAESLSFVIPLTEIPLANQYKCQFYLEIRPKSPTEDYLAISVVASAIKQHVWQPERSSKLKLKIDLSIIDCNGTKSHQKMNRKRLVLQKSTEAVIVPFNKFGQFVHRKLLLDPSNGLLPGDKLTLHCEFEAIDDSDPVQDVPPKPEPSKVPLGKGLAPPADKHQSKLQKLDEDSLPPASVPPKASKPLNNDSVVFVISEEEFTCSGKQSLAKKYPKLGKLFADGRTRVHLDNYEAPVFSDMLSFIYGKEVEGLEQFPDKLLLCSVEYGISELVAKCEDYLSRNVKPGNICDVMFLAWNLSSLTMQEAALAYLKKYQWIQKENFFQDFIEKNPKIAKDAKLKEVMYPKVTHL